MAAPKRWLFVKEHFSWPRSSGHDVHTYNMMKALTGLGHTVGLVTLSSPPSEALAGIPLVARFCLNENQPEDPGESRFPLRMGKFQHKFMTYWGIRPEHVRRVAAAAAEISADVVTVSGLNVLPYLGAIEGRKRVWYAADEWVRHHLSLIHPLRRSTWSELKPAIIKGLYERAYRGMLDRIWVVTKEDARAFGRYVGASGIDVVPNGVDADYWNPNCCETEATPNSCVFWGRLDFGPNIQALEWFHSRVWPAIRSRVPDAQCRIIGFQPTAVVRRLVGKDGVELLADLPDIRTAIRQCAVAVLPFVSGGGIKNKLLEAAALEMPIVCTPMVAEGLVGTIPFHPLYRGEDWVDTITKLWSEPTARVAAGKAARAWVIENHAWEAAARIAVRGLDGVAG